MSSITTPLMLKAISNGRLKVSLIVPSKMLIEMSSNSEDLMALESASDRLTVMTGDMVSTGCEPFVRV